ncbi:MBL fold metallo-hydrolase [Streptomyces sp. NPDC006632]|uniref:MBL fold metallo-hydrolase n=1 Tax=Streptomyces sp. NPDC006632 TaxID=3157182 RepID=UPI0033AB99D1
MTSTARLIPIAPGVHVWAPDGADRWGLANCGLIASGGEAALLDTPYALDLTDTFLAAARAAAPDAHIGTVFTTHGNGDHSWGNQRVTGARIISTRRTLEHQCLEPTPEQLRALIEETDPDQPLGWYFRRHFGSFDFGGITVTPPTDTFEGRLDVRVGDILVELHQTGPAHTVGDLIAHLPEQRVVFTGDIVFAGDHPCHWAGPLANVITACEEILAHNPDHIVPGHGPLLDQDGLRTHIQYLADLAEQARELHARGCTPTTAAQHLIREKRYPGLGLEERLAITLGSEFRHLNNDPADPEILSLAIEAATIAWHNNTARRPATSPS